MGTMTHAVYIHVPFCTRRCGYCGFYSGEPLDLLEAYPEWVLREAGLRGRSGKPWGPLSSVYFGGGTPALLGVAGVERILAGAGGIWGVASGAEVTVEVNPSSDADLAGLRGVGVNRLSVGVQALDDRLLTWLGRGHDARGALDTLRRAVDAGFSSVSADLLYGIPGLRADDLGAWVRVLAGVGVSHFSAYSLELHPGTDLERRISSGVVTPCPPEAEQAQWEGLLEAAAALGYRAYEVSNFARPGAESRHNGAYWDRAPYRGLGPGAHSFDPEQGRWGRRAWNEPGLLAYGEAVGRGVLPPSGGENLTRREALLEALFLALRRSEPVCPPAMASTFELDPGRTATTFSLLAEQGLLLPRRRGCWEPTAECLRRADGLALWAHDRLLEGDGRSA
jgi:oxygen-independent coproporphyrinogen-3 oxidase